ncbi:MAG: DUF362 domain-containing protein [Acidobacteria bacterium]|nr:DUF362 domain-containing protein [Acidobacteriota bacterium]
MKSDRRDFLRALALGAGVGPVFLKRHAFVGTNAYGDKVLPGAAATRVVVARDPGYTPETGLPDACLDAGLKALMEADSPAEAWKKLFRPDDVVGIKVNALGGRNLSPSWRLIQAVVKGLVSAGVAENRIIVWDRTSRELRRAGYPLADGDTGVRVRGTDALEHQYEDETVTSGAVSTNLACMLTRHCTAMVNVGVLKHHDLSGVSVFLKNYYGVISNPFRYHADHCSPFIPQVYSVPIIREKTRLHLADAPVGQYGAGPAYNAAFTWPFGGVILARDPVAGDRVGADLIERVRAEKGEKPLKDAGQPPVYIDEAGRMGLGESDLAKIRVIPLALNAPKIDEPAKSRERGISRE